MCTTCGCGHPDQVRIGELPHVHHDSNAQHAQNYLIFLTPPSACQTLHNKMKRNNDY